MGNMESEEYWGKNITRLIDYGIAQRLNLRSVKLFTDGLSGQISCRFRRLTLSKVHLAPLGQLYWNRFVPYLILELIYDSEQYSDNPSTHGLMRIQPQTLTAFVKQFWKDGWQVVCTRRVVSPMTQRLA